MINLCIFVDKDHYALKNSLWAYADLLLKFPNGEEIYCSSEMCRLVIKKSSAEERMTEIWRSCNNVKYSSDGWRNEKINYLQSLRLEWIFKSRIIHEI